MGTVSVWTDTVDAPGRTLSENLRTDVCVIGAGSAGLTTVYALVKEGRSVVLLERGSIGGGETARTTAHLSNALDDYYFEIEKLFGEDGSRRAQESHAAAIGRIESICGGEKIDCEFTRVAGYLFAAPGEAAPILDHELNAPPRPRLTGAPPI